MGHFAQEVLINSGGDGGFAGVAGKLFEELEVGEAQADDFDPPQDLIGSRLEDGLGFVDLQPVWADQLHGALEFWNGSVWHNFAY